MRNSNLAAIVFALILLAIRPVFVYSAELQSGTEKAVAGEVDSDRVDLLLGEFGISLTPEEEAWLKGHRRIRIGLDPDFAPYSFLGDNGHLTGAAFDFIKLIEGVLGIEFELAEGLSWKDIQKNTRERNLDVMTPALVTEQRKEYLLFTKQYLPTPQVITCRVDDDRFNSASDLIGRRVAVAEGYASSRKVILEYPGIIKVKVANPLEGLQAVSTGRADAFVCGMGVNVHLAVKYGIANLKIAAAYEKDVIGQCFGVRADWPELVSILDKALDKISVKEKHSILHKWVPVSMPSKKTEPSFTVSKQEDEWIQKHPVIKVATDPYWAPVEYQGEDGEFRGISPDYLSAISDVLGIRFEPVSDMTWQQMVDASKAKEIDMFSAFAVTPERTEYLDFSEPYLTIPVAIFARNDVAYIGDLSELNGRKVAVVAGYAVHEWLANDYPEIDLVTFKTISDALENLQRGQVYAYVGNMLTAGYYLGQMKASDLKVVGDTIYEQEICFAVRKDWPILSQLLQKSLDSIDEAMHNKISQKWLTVKYEHGFNYKALWVLMAVVAVIIGAILYWNTCLNRAVNQRTSDLRINEAEREKLVKILEFKNKELQDIVYTASHDLRSPLVNILGFSGELTTSCEHLTKLLLEQNRSEDQNKQIEFSLIEDIPQSLGFITGSAKKMSSLLDGLLQVSRVGTVEVKNERIDMNKKISEILAGMEYRVKQNEISISADSLPDCIADSNMLDHVFTNLIDNSIKYLDPSRKGHVHVSGRVEGDMSVFCICDNGIGIDKEYNDKVFEIFHRLNPGSEVVGVGLGLTIVKRILDRLGGSIWVESELGKGSKFYVSLGNG